MLLHVSNFCAANMNRHMDDSNQNRPSCGSQCGWVKVPDFRLNGHSLSCSEGHKIQVSVGPMFSGAGNLDGFD